MACIYTNVIQMRLALVVYHRHNLYFQLYVHVRCACTRGRPSVSLNLKLTVNKAFEMHFIALCSLKQPYLTAYCVGCNR